MAQAFTVQPDTLKYQHITIGRLRVCTMTTEFQRIDHDGQLVARIAQALSEIPGFADAIKAAAFGEAPVEQEA